MGRYKAVDIVGMITGLLVALPELLDSAQRIKGGSVLGLGTLILFALAPRLRARQEAKIENHVEWDEGEIRRVAGGRVLERIRWDELDEIGIVTNDLGPWMEDAYWLFIGANRKAGCAIANGAQGLRELLPKLTALPGFDHARLIEAMGCTSNRSFQVWRRAAVVA